MSIQERLECIADNATRVGTRNTMQVREERQLNEVVIKPKPKRVWPK